MTILHLHKQFCKSLRAYELKLSVNVVIIFIGKYYLICFPIIAPYSFLKNFTKDLCVRASLVAQMVKNLPAMQESWGQSFGQEDPLEKGMATQLQYSNPGK